MDFYETEDGKTLIAVDLEIPEKKALTQANSYFKVSRDRLEITNGWIKNDELYFSETRGAKKCWLIRRKSPKEA